MSFITQKDRNERDRQSSFDAAVEQGVQAIYSAYPQIKPCTASHGMIIETCNRWAGQPIIPTVELMRSILDENPDAFKSLGLESLKDQRADLIEEICNLLRNENKMDRSGAVRGGKYSPADLAALRSNVLQWKSRDELIAYRDDVLRTQKLAKMSTSELQKIVKESRPQRRADGYPNLPEYLVLPGEVKARRVDAEFLITLSKTNYEYYRNRIVRLYGANQVNERQQGR